MANHIELAAGQVTESQLPADRLSVVLTTTRDGTEQAMIVWPQPTRVSAKKLADTVARICRILANSSVELASRHRRKR
jgi:hypothetical protein